MYCCQTSDRLPVSGSRPCLGKYKMPDCLVAVGHLISLPMLQNCSQRRRRSGFPQQFWQIYLLLFLPKTSSRTIYKTAHSNPATGQTTQLRCHSIVMKL